MRKINQIYTMRSPRRQRVAGYWFVFRPDRERWPRQGGNRIEVTLLERDPEVTPPVELRDVELEVRYLRGRIPGEAGIRTIWAETRPSSAWGRGPAWYDRVGWEKRA